MPDTRPAIPKAPARAVVKSQWRKAHLDDVDEGDLVAASLVNVEGARIPLVIYLYKDDMLWTVSDEQTKDAAITDGAQCHILPDEELGELTIGCILPRVTDPPPDGLYKTQMPGEDPVLLLAQSGKWVEVEADETDAIRLFGPPVDLYPNESGTYGIGVTG
jgi:hypothetical protein